MKRVASILLVGVLSCQARAELVVELPDLEAAASSVTLEDHETHIEKVSRGTNRVTKVPVVPYQAGHVVPEKGLMWSGLVEPGAKSAEDVEGLHAVADRFGRAGYAREHGQSGAIVEWPIVSDSDSLKALTISFWCRTYYRNPEQVVLRLLDDSDAEALCVSLSRGRLPRVTVKSVQGKALSAVGVAPVADYQWHHVVVVYSETGLSISVDGKVKSRTEWRLPIRPFSVVSVGGAGDARHYHGVLDDIRIYDRVLTAEEREQLFREGGWSGSAAR